MKTKKELTADVLAAGFPMNILGMALIVIVWGFFEGINYIVISDKINTRYPAKNFWVNWGAVAGFIFLWNAF